jgi:uncharacterized protein (DUF1330 family)
LFRFDTDHRRVPMATVVISDVPSADAGPRRDRPTLIKENSRMPAYMIINAVPRDHEKLVSYLQQSPATVEKYGGRYLVRGGEFQVLEGDWTPTRLVVLEFPTADHAKRWHDSDEYKPLKELRHTAADADFVLVQGIET